MACLEGYLDDFADLLNLYEDLAESCRSQSLLPELTKAIDSQKQLICYEKTREESLKIFKENCSGFERITEVVNILRNFSNAGLHDQMGYFDLNRAIEDTVMLSGNITEQGISIETNFAQLPLLSGSPSLIKQALLNVLINSMQAVGSSLSATDGKIMIRTFVDGKHVGCAIEDNGPGISEQEQCRIFDPFFSTREPGYGKGLGLSITYDIIVHKHGGKIACVCPAAGGTTVTLLFPLVEPVMG
jgi:signal transduction histidine kinase